MTTGADGRVRLWDLGTGRHQRVHYPTANRSSGARRSAQLAVSTPGDVAFVPSGAHILVLEVATGALLATLRGHFEHIAAVALHTTLHELYSGGLDKQIVAWTPRVLPGSVGERALEDDADAWSDDENDREDNARANPALPPSLFSR